MSLAQRLRIRVTHVLRRAGRLFVSERAGRVLIAVASLVTIVGLPIAVLQLCDLREQQVNRATSLLLIADQQLTSGSNRAIRHAILTGRPLNTFTPEELGDYLDILEGIALNHERGLVDIDSIDDWHGDTITKTYQHPDVQTYVRDQQKDDADYYSGFQALGKRLVKLNPRRPAPALKAPLDRRQ